MLFIDTSFARFPNMPLLQEEAVDSTQSENKTIIEWSSEKLSDPAKQLGLDFQWIQVRIQQLDLEIQLYSKCQSSSDLTMLIEQLSLRRTDCQEVILQNAQLSDQIWRLQWFVIDLWKSFKPDNYKPTKFFAVPVVKWATGISAAKGPYTWSSEDIQIISMPSRYAEKGILGWTTLAHEVSHDFLEGSGGLINTLRFILQQNLPEATGNQQVLKNYFVSRISEIGADIMGIVILGPASGIGQVAYLRSQRNGFLLCTEMSPKGVHPVDICRAYLAAYAMNVLMPNCGSQNGGSVMPIQDWNDYCTGVMGEILKDLSKAGGYITVTGFQNQMLQIHCNEVADYCRQTVKILIDCLRERVQIDNWKWNENDEQIVEKLIRKDLLPSSFDSRHIVAAAFFESLERTLLQNPMEKSFYTPQVHTDYQGGDNAERARIKNVFNHAMKMIKK